MTDDSAPSSAADRRRAARLSGGAYPLRLGRLPARLVDWSPRGLGLQSRGPVDGILPGQALTVSIHSDITNGVALFPVIVRRVDPARQVIGADFLADGEDASDFLARVLAVSAVDS